MNGQFYLQIGDRVAERYRIVSILGQGGSGVTYAAEDLHSHQQLALKQMSLKGMKNWKQLELFEREAQVLSQLHHPAIPNYIDYFQTDTEQNRCFYIVQELAPGHSLADLVKEGWQASEAEVRQLGVQILNILKYLHELTPPIIHRDIKPQNIIRSDDGQVYLVDFGAVQNVYRHTMVGSTVVGTYGYMAPEHFQGKAVPATDLYSLGGTLLFLLTHCSPADLPQKRLKIDFRSAVQLDPDFADWLDLMLAPAVEDRLTSAEDALVKLTQPKQRPARPKSLSRRKLAALYHQPKGSKIRLQKSESHLIVDIPPTGLRETIVGIGLFALFCEGIVFVVLLSLFMSVLKGGVFSVVIVVVWLALALMGAGLLMAAIFGMAGRIRLEINPEHFQLLWQIKSLGWRCWTQGKTADLDVIKLTTAYTSNQRPVAGCTLIEGNHTHKFGTLLSLQEKEWLVYEISDFLRRQQR